MLDNLLICYHVAFGDPITRITSWFPWPSLRSSVPPFLRPCGPRAFSRRPALAAGEGSSGSSSGRSSSSAGACGGDLSTVPSARAEQHSDHEESDVSISDIDEAVLASESLGTCFGKPWATLMSIKWKLNMH